MMKPLIGKGLQYLTASVDADNEWFDGCRSYVLRVPAKPPAKDFWSVTACDAVTRSQIDAAGVLHHRELLGELSRAAAQTAKELLAAAADEEEGFRPGVVAVVQTFGDRANFQGIGGSIGDRRFNIGVS